MSRFIEKNILTPEEIYLKIDKIERALNELMKEKKISEDEIIKKHMELIKEELRNEIFKELQTELLKK